MIPAAIMLLLVAPIFGQTKWSLQNCIDYGFSNNSTAKQNDLQSELAKLQVKQGENAFLPSLNITLGPGLSFGRSPVGNAFSYTTQSITNTSLNSDLNLILYNGKQRKYNNSLYQQNWKIALLQNEKLKNDITLTVIAYYLQTLLSKEQIDLAKLQAVNTKSQLNNIRALFKATVKPEIDVAELESQVAKDSLNIIIAEESFQQNLLELKNYLSLDPATPFDIQIPQIDSLIIEPISNLDPEKIYEIAVNNLPLFKIDMLKLKTEELNLKLAKSAYIPTISVDLGLSSGYSQVLSKSALSKIPFFTQAKNNFRQFLNLNFSFPVFDGYKTKNNISRSLINIRSQQQNFEQDKLKLKQEIYKAYQSAKSSFQKFQVSEMAMISAEKTLSIFEKKYSAGILNTIDLITNQTNLYKAKQDYVINHFDYIFKIKILEFYQKKQF